MSNHAVGIASDLRSCVDDRACFQAVAQDAGTVDQSVAEWTSLAQSRKFQEALTSVEKVLSDEPTNVSARLWWVLTQAELENVPVSALGSSLEDLLPDLSTEQPANRNLAALTFFKVASKLFERNQLRLGVSMLEQGYGLAITEEGAPFHAALLKLHACLKSALDAELKRAEDKRENRDYVSGLKDKVKKYASPPKLQKKEVAATNGHAAFEQLAESAPAKSSKKKPFNSKALLEAAAQADSQSGFILGENLKPEVSVSAAVVSSAATEKQKLTAQQESFRNRIYATAGIVMILALGVFLQDHFSAAPNLTELDSRLAAPFAIDSKEKLIQPPFMIASVPGGMLAISLDKSLERLKKMNEKRGQNEGSAADPAASPDVDTAAIKSAEALIPPEPKENTTVASDIPESKAVKMGSFGNVGEAKQIPDLNPGRFEGVTVNPSDANRKAEVLDPKHGVAPQILSPDGRVFGPPPDQNGRTLDGRPVQGYEVERFSIPVIYRMIAPSRVLSSASMTGMPVDELPRDAEVEVVGQTGPWLELRSKRGRVGYIYAQDAIKVRFGR